MPPPPESTPPPESPESPESTRRGHMQWIIVLLVTLITAAVVWFVWPRPPLQGETEYDFGTVHFTQGPHSSRHTFTLTNVSSSPVRVVRSVSSCGCTQALAPDSRVAPGATLDVPVTLSLVNSGLKSSKVTLILEDQRRIALHVTAVGKADHTLAASPSRLMLRSPRGVGVLTLKAQADTVPPEPVVQVPEGLMTQFEGWSSFLSADESKQRPQTWEAHLVCTVEGSGPMRGSELVIAVEGAGTVTVPVGPPPRPSQVSPPAVGDQDDAQETPSESPPADH